MGVKLKKVCYSRTPIEYEMTPYEILMDDIRSRRYTLKKVDGAIPPRFVCYLATSINCHTTMLFPAFAQKLIYTFFNSVKKDAHAMILEFIRSRPPLKKVSF